MQQGMQLQTQGPTMAVPPRHPGSLSPTALDDDFDEELVLRTDISNSPPPPPPPPPRRRNSNGGSSRHQRRTMEQTQEEQLEQEQQQEQQYQQQQFRQRPTSPKREPFNNLSPESDKQQQQQQFHYSHEHPSKEHISCDPTVRQYSDSSQSNSNSNSSGSNTPFDVPAKTSPKKKKQYPPRSDTKNTSKNRPPIQPQSQQQQAGSKSAEYSDRIQSFHEIMLDNIEKETNLIRNVGSFQMHHKNLSLKNHVRKQQQQQQHQQWLNSGNGNGNGNEDSNSNRENQNKTPKQRSDLTSHLRYEDMTVNADLSNASLLKETMNDISVAYGSTIASLRSALQHTKDMGGVGDMKFMPNMSHLSMNNLNKVVRGGEMMACGNANDTSTAFGDNYGEDADNDDDESLLASPLSAATNAKQKNKEMPTSAMPPRNSSAVKDSQGLAAPVPGPVIPLIRTASGTDIMKRTFAAFHKVVTDATTTGTDSSNGNGIGDDENHKSDPKPDEREEEEDIWGVGNMLANGFGYGGESEDDDDGRSQKTYDTWDDENSVLRRLGSWGTVNSQFTAGTTGTAATGATFGTLATYDTEGPSVMGPVSIAVAAAAAKKAAAAGRESVEIGDSRSSLGSLGNSGEMAVPGSQLLMNNSPPNSSQPDALHDDDGSLIDPVLVEAAIKKQKDKNSKKKKKKRRERKKVVKFDYPPVKSLRQYIRPAREDLPKLFFTEFELDQIEDDRYSTMSTDDIEIVAVSSKEVGGASADDNDNDDALDAKATKKKSGKSASFAKSEKSSPKEQDYEPGMRPVKGRPSTPNRRRTCDDDGPERGSSSKTSSKQASSSAQQEEEAPRRLVKGVQIYLRERSTGA